MTANYCAKITKRQQIITQYIINNIFFFFNRWLSIIFCIFVGENKDKREADFAKSGILVGSFLLVCPLISNNIKNKGESSNSKI